MHQNKENCGLNPSGGKIVLASGSPRREKLLKQLGLEFTVCPSSVDEHFDPSDPPGHIAKELALRKARDVAPGFPNALVIAADTIVVFEGDILEKPASEQEAVEMLSRLAGNTHSVFTGVALAKTGPESNIRTETAFFVETEVRFGMLTEDEIRSYVQSGSPMDKAGAYGIQDDWGALFVESIRGDYYTVVGFPLHAFYREMKSFAPEFLDELQ